MVESLRRDLRLAKWRHAQVDERLGKRGVAETTGNGIPDMGRRIVFRHILMSRGVNLQIEFHLKDTGSGGLI